MTVKSVLFMTAGACAIATTVSAQSLRDAKPPANLPPENFTGLQFVDNKGCVYVRSGFGGQVTWVPRVDRARRQLCSDEFAPTFAAAKTQDAPKAKPAKKPGLLAGLQKAIKTPKPSDAATGTTTGAKAAVKTATAAVPAQETPPAAKPAARKPLFGDLFKSKPKAAVAEKPSPDEPIELLTPAPDTANDVADDAVDNTTVTTAAAAPAPAPAPKPAAKPAARKPLFGDLFKPKPKPAAKPKVAVKKPVVVAATPKPKKPQTQPLFGGLLSKAKKAVKAPEATAKPAPKPAAKPVVKAPAKKVAVQAAKPAPKPAAQSSQPVAKGLYVEVGTFSPVSEGESLAGWFRKSGHKARMVGDKLIVGPFRTSGSAKAAQYQARGAGYPKAKLVDY